MLYGKLCVFRGLHAFQDEGQAAAFAHFLHPFPGQAGLQRAGVFAITLNARRSPAGYELAFAPAVIGGIDRQADRRVPGVAGTVDQRIDPIFVSPNMDLEYLWMVGRLGDFFQCRLGHRADQVHCAELGGGFGDCNAAFGCDGLERSDRRQETGDTKIMPHECSAGVDLADIAEDTRAQRMAVQAMTVAAERGFGFRRPGDVIPDRPAGIIAGGHDDFVHRCVIFRHLIVLSNWVGIPRVFRHFLTLLMPSSPLNSHRNLISDHIN